MQTVNIANARRFSLAEVQVGRLLDVEGMSCELVCFEAGQSWPGRDGQAVVYQVLEGEALVRVGDATERVGKGRLVALGGDESHALENAGGGLLVVLAVRRG
jgi:quercetin dioxygenase-like cupin family protein